MPPVAEVDEALNSSFSVTDFKAGEESSEFVAVDRRRVKFNDEAIRTHEYEGVEEVHYVNVWYLNDDYAVIKETNSLIVGLVKAQSFEESDAHSFRGLEHRLRVRNKERRLNKSNGVNYVLAEQDRQIASQTNDPELISKEYLKVSFVTRHDALVRGLQDAASAGYSDHAATLAGLSEQLVTHDDACSIASETSGATADSRVSKTKKKSTMFRRPRRANSLRKYTAEKS